jgi:hypothetical protein
VVFYTAASDTGEMHFLANSLANLTDTDFYIYYGNISASDYAVSDTYGRNAVWAGYDVVYHFQGNPTSGAIVDSTGNTANGTGGSAVTSEASYDMGNGIDFPEDGTNGILTIGHDTNYDLTSTGTFLWTMTCRSWGTLGTYGTILVKRSGATGYEVFLEDTGTGTETVCMRLRDGATRYDTYSGINIFDMNTKVRLGITLDGSDIKFFKDGAQFGTTQAQPANAATNTVDVLFGTSELDAILDEFRWSKTKYSSGWINAVYENQNAPSSFYTVGSVEGEIKSINGLAIASVKSFNGLAIASVKSINGLTI